VRLISSAIRRVEQRLGREAKDHEVAAELEVSLDAYYEMMQDGMASKVFSFQNFDDEDETSGEDRIASDSPGPLEDIADAGFQQNLASAIRQLPEREQLVLSLYYDEELNLKEIGEVLGVSESRVSQLHSQAAHRLRARLSGWLDT
jgi:RNA polymerase sigma factor for flagellar operon FliA